jgi:hypothetical protein
MAKRKKLKVKKEQGVGWSSVADPLAWVRKGANGSGQKKKENGKVIDLNPVMSITALRTT